MWTCPLCNQRFIHTNQSHSCGDKELSDFLGGKSDHTISLFRHFVYSFRKVGIITIHPTKSMIAVAATTRIAYIIKLGKNFVDIVFPLKEPYRDNLCFHKIAQVPGTHQFNHHFRMCFEEDVNEEVMHFMKVAYDGGK